MHVDVHHYLPGRVRLRYDLYSVKPRQAVLAQTLISVQEGVIEVEVNPRAGSFLVKFDDTIIGLSEIISLFKAMDSKYLEDESLLEAVSEIPLMESIFDVFVKTFLSFYVKKLFLPLQIRNLILFTKIILRVSKAFKSLLEGRIFSMELLDAAALVVSALTGDLSSSNSISTLLDMGEEIEEITRRQSYLNLAQTLLIGNEDVHVVEGDIEKILPLSAVQKGALIAVRTGQQICADGEVERGEALVNQALITGESLPVEKKTGSGVFAGTIVEEGELYIRVRTLGSETKVQNIISMIDNSQNLKSFAEKKSEQFADKIVPFNFLLTGLTWLITRNITKTVSTLMVDYSCAMKLAAPISVLSAMKEAAEYGISVKGGKFLEEAALVETVLFDKTGTLTYANPVLEAIYPLNGFSEDEVLKLSACLEEHFPHPLGRAVVTAAEQKGLQHPETHAKVEYIAAHGIASTLENKKLRIGSSHFIFEDEKVPFENEAKKIQKLSMESGRSLLYLAVDSKLAGILAIGDPIRPNSSEIIDELKFLGVKKCVMITGDTEGAAKKIAKKAGIDKWYSQALPEDKVKFVNKEKNKGKKVLMIGDGINDAPALAASDVGVAIDGCSSIAGETADIVIHDGGLYSLVVVRQLGQRLLSRIQKNNRIILAGNTILLAGGIAGIISPALAALLHNSLTVGISVAAMKKFFQKNEGVEN